MVRVRLMFRKKFSVMSAVRIRFMLSVLDQMPVALSWLELGRCWCHTGAAAGEWGPSETWAGHNLCTSHTGPLPGFQQPLPALGVALESELPNLGENLGHPCWPGLLPHCRTDLRAASAALLGFLTWLKAFLDNVVLVLMEFSIPSASAKRQQNILGQGLRRAQAAARGAGAEQPLAFPSANIYALSFLT